MRVAVVGAGVTGLTTAFALRHAGADVTVYEAAPSAGGVIATAHDAGYLVERGPSSIAATPAARALVAALGIADEVTPAAPASRTRYLVQGGQLVAVPASPLGLLRTPLLTVRGRARALLEPFVRATALPDESVAAFVRRRLGREVLEAFVAPLVAGIHAGDPERLSARHALPMMAALERDHGSLLRGAIARRPRGRDACGHARGEGRRESISFRRGMATLPNALAAALGDALVCGAEVRALAPSAGGRWRLRYAQDGTTRHADVDRVVLAVPAHALAAIAPPEPFGGLLAPIAAVDHAPVATLALGFRRADVAHPLDGFGMLAAPSGGTTVSGVLFASSLFPARCPRDHVLLTCFVGGVLARAHAAAALDALLPRVLADLRALLGVRGAPVFVRHTPVMRAIPQYVVGHDAVEDAADAAERAAGGTLVLAGSWRGGVSVPDCIAAGRAAAARILRTPSPTAAATPTWHANCPPSPADSDEEARRGDEVGVGK